MKEGKLKVVVPVRLGSQRVKLKSFRLLNGKPLISYIIETLKGSEYLRDVYINSDSELYGAFAKEAGVKFYPRSPELATSQSMIDDYIYDFIINEGPDYLAVVNPTSPFISAKELDKAWEQYRDSDADTQLCCEKIQTHCFYKGAPINFSTNGQHPRSQDLEPVLALNFAITLIDCKKYRENYERNNFGLYTGKLGFFITEGRSNIDIDYEEDFWFAEFVARFENSGEKLKAAYHSLVDDIIKEGKDVSN